jgi:hypothetical protein
MAKLKDLNNFKITKRLLSVFGWVKRHPSLILILFLFLDVLLSWFLYSNYYLALDSQKVSASNVVKVDRNLLTKISDEWQKREDNLKSIETKIYPDYFSLRSNRLASSTNQTNPTTKENLLDH